MKNIVRRLKMRASASQKKTQSVDPIKAYRARLEIGIYVWLLDLIAKELEAEQAASNPAQTVQTVQTVQTEQTVPAATAGASTTGGCACAPIGVQAA